jgi:hydrogenase nickel incorporation protein HypA/HybF
MHELSVTNNLIQLVLTECKKRSITQPKKIIVDLGGFTSYSKDSVLFYYDILKKEHPLIRTTTLVVNELPGRITCNTCKKDITITDASFMCCPYCHGMDITIEGGKEFILKEIEAEV